MIRLAAPEDIFVLDRDNPASLLRRKGKFSTVYKGRSEKNNEVVVIKELSESLSGNEQEIERFRREIELQVHHPNIVKTLAYVQHEGRHYLVREFVVGTDLGQLSKTKRLQTAVAIAYFAQVLQGLEALHANGTLHCDIRPSNILVNEITGDAKLTDLGLARKKMATGERRPFSLVYSPPEQLLNRSSLINETSDIYCVGLALYEVLTGQLPFYHENPELLMNLQLTQPVANNKHLSQGMYDIVLKATAKYPFPKPPIYYSEEDILHQLTQAQQRRFQTCAEMEQALLSFDAGTIRPQPWWKR